MGIFSGAAFGFPEYYVETVDLGPVKALRVWILLWWCILLSTPKYIYIYTYCMRHRPRVKKKKKHGHKNTCVGG